MNLLNALAHYIVRFSARGSEQETIRVEHPIAGMIDVRSMQQSGIASRPEDGSVGIMALLGGDASKPVVIATESGSIPVTLAKGEACVFAADGKAYIHIKQGGEIEMFAATTNIIGNLAVNGNVTATGTISP